VDTFRLKAFCRWLQVRSGSHRQIEAKVQRGGQGVAAEEYVVGGERNDGGCRLAGHWRRALGRGRRSRGRIGPFGQLGRMRHQAGWRLWDLWDVMQQGVKVEGEYDVAEECARLASLGR